MKSVKLVKTNYYLLNISIQYTQYIPSTSFSMSVDKKWIEEASDWNPWKVRRKFVMKILNTEYLNIFRYSFKILETIS